MRLRAGQLAISRPDAVIGGMAFWGVIYVAWVARWVPGWWVSFTTFALLGAGPFALRWLARRSEKLRWCDVAASFWLLPAAVLGHQALGPVVDAAHPTLVDAALAQADLRLFGVLPAAVFSVWAGRALTEILLVCYYGYFVWPLLLGLILYVGGQRKAYEHYTLALALTFAMTFVGYALMPAVGPRFLFSHVFQQPLQGLWLTPWLDSAMRGPAFMRDCFPSGHTAITLIVLSFAYRYQRRFFWCVLPAGMGLIAATLVGRFHYGVDLVCALPVVLLTTLVSSLLMRSQPLTIRISPAPTPLWGAREIL